MTSLVWLSRHRSRGWRRRRRSAARARPVRSTARARLSGLMGEDRVMTVATHDDRLEPLGNQVLDPGRHQEERRR